MALPIPHQPVFRSADTDFVSDDKTPARATVRQSLGNLTKQPQPHLGCVPPVDATEQDL